MLSGGRCEMRPRCVYRMPLFKSTMAFYQRFPFQVLVTCLCLHEKIQDANCLNLPVAATPHPPAYSLFVFGYGNVGSAVADLASRVSYIDDSPRLSGVSVDDCDSSLQYVPSQSDSTPVFHSICATVRRLEQDSKIPASSIHLIEFTNHDAVAEHLSKATHVLVTIPPTAQQQPPLLYVDPVLSSRYINHIPQNAWVGYVSTTGVYGNHDGDWVNESSETRALSTTKAYAYLQTEVQWQQLAQQRQWKSCCVFRCAGLYGKQSSALHTVWKQWRQVERRDVAVPENPTGNKNRDTEFVTSRIHLEDVSRAILLAIVSTQEATSDTVGAACTIYNLADNEPALRDTVMEYAKRLILHELEQHSQNELYKLPKFTEQQHSSSLMTAVMASTSPSERRKRQTSESKRVSNGVMLELLRPYGGLLYPSYREGLLSILYQGREK